MRKPAKINASASLLVVFLKSLNLARFIIHFAFPAKIHHHKNLMIVLKVTFNTSDSKSFYDSPCRKTPDIFIACRIPIVKNLFHNIDLLYLTFYHYKYPQ